MHVFIANTVLETWITVNHSCLWDSTVALHVNSSAKEPYAELDR